MVDARGVATSDVVLALEDVSKRYGKVPALSGLNLRVKRGQVYGLLGRNGAGKSTALRIVMGVTRADSGSMMLFGATTKPSNVEARQRIGYVAQEQLFYEWMTPDQLGRFVSGFYPTWKATYFTELLRRFDVPHRKIRTLSGGTKVKLALALALSHSPELLVLDEPTAGLDAVARREFLDIVRDHTQAGMSTTVFSSHLIDDVERVADQVGVIDAGRMRFEGGLSDLSCRVRRVTLEVPTEMPLFEDIGVRVIDDDTRGTVRQIMFYSDEPACFEALAARLAPRVLEGVPLEDIFIALVRSRQAEPKAELPAE